MEIYLEVVILLLAIITAILLRLCLHVSCRRYDCRYGPSQPNSTEVGVGRTFRLRRVNGQYFDYEAGRNNSGLDYPAVPPPSYIVVIENTPPPPTYEEYLKSQMQTDSTSTINIKTETNNVISNDNELDKGQNNLLVPLGYI